MVLVFVLTWSQSWSGLGFCRGLCFLTYHGHGPDHGLDVGYGYSHGQCLRLGLYCNLGVVIEGLLY